MTFKGFIFLICSIMLQKLFGQQLPKNVIKITAFTQEVQMGNIPVDDGGKPLKNGPDTTYSIFIETKTNVLPKWQKAYRNGIIYTLSLTDSTNNETTELIAARGHNLKPIKGNKLWKYELVVEEMPKKVSTNPTNIITLEGKYNGKKINFPIKNIITLEPELRP